MNPATKPSILLLEDEASIAEAIVFCFEKEGFTIQHASSCMDALAALRSGSFDCAIFDIGLPDGSGLELCKEVRQFSPLPILFLTARNDEIDRILGLEIGGDDYITKPFSPRELVARVRAVLRRTQRASTSQPLAVSPEKRSHALAIDLSSCQAWLRETELPLTKAEFQLLAKLLGSPQRVFNRDQLLNAISEDPGASTDRVIDAHIKAIRAKIRAVCSDTAMCIETRRGLGYCFNPMNSHYQNASS